MSKPEVSQIGLIADDGWLSPYEGDIRQRIARYQKTQGWINEELGGLMHFASGYRELGFVYDSGRGGWWYREWAPAATGMFLTGDFNGWDRQSHPMTRAEGDIWELFLADSEYRGKLVHGSLLKVHVVTPEGGMDRVPAWATRVVQNPETKDFTCQFWNPEGSFTWTDAGFDAEEVMAMPLIYEAHIGIAQEKEGVGSYREFADMVLPRIKAAGYNVVQCMAIQEHPYYGSFGYHVSSFFAPSSRFGTPEDLKYLVNKAHAMGLAVIMDLVHSHAVKNVAEGLNQFDGTDYQYFHGGGRGYHDQWDSRLFNYAKPEVMRFLLSNVRYWLEEFHFDGYRFDGVTSMMYLHHGMGVGFDHYDKYFRDLVDDEAILYLQLACEVAHRVKPHALLVAEDMSGMPGLCRRPEDGGIGFDFRLGMGLPDFWIKYLKHVRDEDWNIQEMYGIMTNRRYKEKTIAYVESHDQAIVGDKTTAFWLMDKEMYWHMSKGDDNLVIERGLALHKLMRLFTLALGGEGYLNFIGNEFGHPEWVDFPREGNDWSYKYARRQWSLVDHAELKYMYFNAFDAAMIELIKVYGTLRSGGAEQLNMDEANKVVVFKRGALVFAFNFNPTASIPDYRFYVPEAGTYRLVLSSDDVAFGGHGRIDSALDYESIDAGTHHELSVYLTNRTALVWRRVE